MAVTNVAQQSWTLSSQELLGQRLLAMREASRLTKAGKPRKNLPTLSRIHDELMRHDARGPWVATSAVVEAWTLPRADAGR